MKSSNGDIAGHLSAITGYAFEANSNLARAQTLNGDPEKVRALLRAVGLDVRQIEDRCAAILSTLDTAVTVMEEEGG